ncbi:PREDICTED: uncharacterized protein LOC109132288 [Camelina sativa]|uniref:Uncharacterized protein LOC109132288 n=1 Tax=Camelina sativa TaxID=90675 RepID=A0ABM1RK97_CAMSA|nr:PREDICTED: uncharacterized protein LOC109132288 [Camelina sativa]
MSNVRKSSYIEMLIETSRRGSQSVECVVGDGPEAPPRGESQSVVRDRVHAELQVASESGGRDGDRAQTEDILNSGGEDRARHGFGSCCFEDDCRVYGDEDCDIVDDAIGCEDNNDEEVDNGLAIEEDANINIEEDFPEAARLEDVGSDNDSGDDI